jgi:hypothetical protein
MNSAFMRSVLVFLAWYSCLLPAAAGEAPKTSSVPATAPRKDLGITVFIPHPIDMQILSARYTMLSAPVRDAKTRLAGMVANNDGFVTLAVSDRLCDNAFDMANHLPTLAAALGSAAGAGMFNHSPLVPNSVAAELSEDRGTLTVENLYEGKLCQKRAHYGAILVLP